MRGRIGYASDEITGFIPQPKEYFHVDCEPEFGYSLGFVTGVHGK